jgi:hypothetical protein
MDNHSAHYCFASGAANRSMAIGIEWGGQGQKKDHDLHVYYETKAKTRPRLHRLHAHRRIRRTMIMYSVHSYVLYVEYWFGLAEPPDEVARAYLGLLPIYTIIRTVTRYQIMLVAACS